MSGRVVGRVSEIRQKSGEALTNARAAGESYKTDPGPVSPASVRDNRFKRAFSRAQA